MNAGSIPRSRLRRFALCTAAVAAALALFPGIARADDGLSALVGDTVGNTVEQLVPPAAAPVVAPVVDVISTVEEAVPAAVDPAVDAVAQTADATTDSALPALKENEESMKAPTGGTPQLHESMPGGGSASSVTPDADTGAPVEAESAPTATAGASEVAAPSRPGETPTAAVSRQPTVGSPQTPSPGGVASYAPATPVIVADAQAGSAMRLPAFPRPTDSGLPGFDVPLPPLAAFALLLALPLGILALGAPGTRGRGVSPGVALLRSVDVRFRLVRPG